MNHVAVTANKTSDSEDKNVSEPVAVPFPVFKLGDEAGGFLDSVPAQEEADHHQSILDIDIPDAGQLDVTEAPDLMRQESFLTEVEEFHNTETKGMEELHNIETNEVVSPELEAELRPVFDLCQPNSAGLISIEHLRAMCREHGQVNYLRSFPPNTLHTLSFDPSVQNVLVMRIEELGEIFNYY